MSGNVTKQPKRRNVLLWILPVLALSAVLLLLLIPSQQKKNYFPVVETSISEIHSAMRAGEITCLQLVDIYLKRIEAYDQSTQLNAIIIVNPHAKKRAKELDKEFRKTGILRPLHGIPLIIKDNYDTKDLQTTGGRGDCPGQVKYGGVGLQPDGNGKFYCRDNAESL